VSTVFIALPNNRVE